MFGVLSVSSISGVGSGFVVLSVRLLAALVVGCGTCPEGKFKSCCPLFLKRIV